MSAKSPFKALWPVRQDRLWAAEYPGDLSPEKATAKLLWLLDAGVRRFVDLTESGELGLQGQALRPYDGLLRELAARRGLLVRYARFPVRDLAIPSEDLMRQTLCVLSDAIHRREIVLVHCRGGVGRTGTVVGCWLVEQGMTPDEALAEIARLRAEAGLPKFPRAPEMSSQVEFVRKWKPRK